MKFTEAHSHQLFRIGVVLKGIDGFLEAVGGMALLFTPPASLRSLIDWLTRGELQEDPTDFVANHLVHLVHHLPRSTEHFASAYLLTYGIAKVGLVVGLLKGRLWAYPAALTVLGLFFCYQIVRIGETHSLGLSLVSVIDLLILVLIWREYRSQKSRTPSGGARENSGGDRPG